MNDNVLEFKRPKDDPQFREINVLDLLDAVQAKELAPGVTLMTKDGRTIGNAIVIKETEPSSEAMKDFIRNTGQKLWLIETDFGNRAKLTDNEINEWFHLGYPHDHDIWWDARLEKIHQGIEHAS
jgi:hypothetical protein